jgi:23S rRNA (cytosine1962-C5)-methyltransferase
MARPPKPSKSNHKRLPISEGVLRAIEQGHPWVFQDGILAPIDGLASGAIVELVRSDNTFVARAIVEPQSALAVRVLTRQKHEIIDQNFILNRLERALLMRSSLVAADDLTAYRLCHGEADGLPGWVIDRYNQVAVLRLDGPFAHSLWEKYESVVWERLQAEGITSLIMRSSGRDVKEKWEKWLGEEPPEVINVLEFGMKMHVNLKHGQKTGAFLDQRDNRRRVRELARGKRVLNLFSYAGGFSIAAALGGASHVTSVDSASQAHASAQKSVKLNDLPLDKHSFVTADVFAYLEQAKLKGNTWDVVISDPPNFAPNEKSKQRALQAYKRLHLACMDVLSKHGIFCAASCSSHVPMESFLSTLTQQPGHLPEQLRLLGMYGSPADHPTLPGFPEGRYLKFAILS